MNSAKYANSISSIMSPPRRQRSGSSPWAESLIHWSDMEDIFLCNYYSVGKTSVVRRAIHEFSKGSGEVSMRHGRDLEIS